MGILHNTHNCETDHEMSLNYSEIHDIWRCKRGLSCSYGIQKSLPFNSKLVNCRSIYHNILKYSWSKQFTTTTFCAEELSMSAVAIPDWKNVLSKIALCSADSIWKISVKLAVSIKQWKLMSLVFQKENKHVGRVYAQRYIDDVNREQWCSNFQVYVKSVRCFWLFSFVLRFSVFRVI